MTETSWLSSIDLDNLDRAGAVEELVLVVAMLAEDFCVDDFLLSVLEDVFLSPALASEVLDLFIDSLEIADAFPSDFLDNAVGTICELDLCFLSLSLASS